MKTQEIQLLCLQQIRVLHLWLEPLALVLHFQHLIFPIGQLIFIIRFTSLNFNNFLLPAMVIMSSFDHLYVQCCKNFECLPIRQHSICLSWHCNLSVTGRRGAQCLSGRLLGSRPRGRGFKPHRSHCVVILAQGTFILA